MQIICTIYVHHILSGYGSGGWGMRLMDVVRRAKSRFTARNACTNPNESSRVEYVKVLVRCTQEKIHAFSLQSLGCILDTFSAGHNNMMMLHVSHKIYIHIYFIPPTIPHFYTYLYTITNVAHATRNELDFVLRSGVAGVSYAKHHHHHHVVRRADFLRTHEM